MTSHRRPGLLARFRSHRTSPASPAPVPSIELVDGRTRVAHRVTSDELLAGRLAGGVCTALCGVRVVAASLTDPGRDRCSTCTS